MRLILSAPQLPGRQDRAQLPDLRQLLRARRHLLHQRQDADARVPVSGAGVVRVGYLAPCKQVTDRPQSVSPWPQVCAPTFPFPAPHAVLSPLTPVLSLRSQVPGGDDGAALRGLYRQRAAEQPYVWDSPAPGTPRGPTPNGAGVVV